MAFSIIPHRTMDLPRPFDLDNLKMEKKEGRYLTNLYATHLPIVKQTASRLHDVLCIPSGRQIDYQMSIMPWDMPTPAQVNKEPVLINASTEHTEMGPPLVPVGKISRHPHFHGDLDTQGNSSPSKRWMHRHGEYEPVYRSLCIQSWMSTRCFQIRPMITHVLIRLQYSQRQEHTSDYLPALNQQNTIRNDSLHPYSVAAPTTYPYINHLKRKMPQTYVAPMPTAKAIKVPKIVIDPTSPLQGTPSNKKALGSVNGGLCPLSLWQGSALTRLAICSHSMRMNPPLQHNPPYIPPAVVQGNFNRLRCPPPMEVNTVDHLNCFSSAYCNTHHMSHPQLAPATSHKGFRDAFPQNLSLDSSYNITMPGIIPSSSCIPDINALLSSPLAFLSSALSHPPQSAPAPIRQWRNGIPIYSRGRNTEDVLDLPTNMKHEDLEPVAYWMSPKYAAMDSDDMADFHNYSNPKAFAAYAVAMEKERRLEEAAILAGSPGHSTDSSDVSSSADEDGYDVNDCVECCTNDEKEYDDDGSHGVPDHTQNIQSPYYFRKLSTTLFAHLSNQNTLTAETRVTSLAFCVITPSKSSTGSLNYRTSCPSMDPSPDRSLQTDAENRATGDWKTTLFTLKKSELSRLRVIRFVLPSLNCTTPGRNGSIDSLPRDWLVLEAVCQKRKAKSCEGHNTEDDTYERDDTEDEDKHGNSDWNNPQPNFASGHPKSESPLHSVVSDVPTNQHDESQSHHDHGKPYFLVAIPNQAVTSIDTISTPATNTTQAGFNGAVTKTLAFGKSGRYPLLHSRGQGVPGLTPSSHSKQYLLHEWIEACGRGTASLEIVASPGCEGSGAECWL